MTAIRANEVIFTTDGKMLARPTGGAGPGEEVDIPSGGASIPILTTDPVAPADGDLWLLRETTGAITVPDGEPIGTLGMGGLTYTSSPGAVQPLKLRVYDVDTIRSLQFV